MPIWFCFFWKRRIKQLDALPQLFQKNVQAVIQLNRNKCNMLQQERQHINYEPKQKANKISYLMENIFVTSSNQTK